MIGAANSTMAARGGRGSGRFELARNRTMRIAQRGATTIRVDSGVVVVTREGDLEDHVLERGMELAIFEPGLVVAWALEASTLRVAVADPRRRAA